MNKKVEILSPAGSYESLKAAISAGADAVYIGGSRFGARAFANNLQEEELLEAIDYVHLHGKQIYLTVNTLLKENEIEEELYEYLLPYYQQGLDAVIVQDIGVLKFIRHHFPDLPVHASTQMTITNVSGAKFLEKLGVERVVTAREMTLPEIAEIAKETNLEIESFVHGALCYCYSGQCLYSSLIGGRSGNRGQCAQPCRLPYKTNGKTSYVMSLKDMCALELIPDLIEAGIFSFKIEGRMKKPEYVAAVTAMYRKYVDLYLEKGRKGFRVSARDKEILMDIYNRGGFHNGYYKNWNGKEMLALTRPNHAGLPAVKVLKHTGKDLKVKAIVGLRKGDILELPDQENYTLGKDVPAGEETVLHMKCKKNMQNGMVLNRTRNEQLLGELREEIVERKVQEKINGKLILSSGKHATLTLTYQEHVVTITGEMVQIAKNQPMDSARIEKQMRKTGNTPFQFGQLEIVIEGNIFLPMQALNDLRRQGMECLELEVLKKYRRNLPHLKDSEMGYHVEQQEKPSGFYVYVEKLEQFQSILNYDFVKRIYVDCNMVRYAWKNPELRLIVKEAQNLGKEIYFAMPYIFRSDAKKRYEHFFEDFYFDGILVRNYESFLFAKEKAKDISVVVDCNLYEFNHYAKQFWIEQGVSGLTAPLELNYKELLNLGIRDMEFVAYGYLQMMVSAQCIRKTTDRCTKEPGLLKITDRKNKDFYVKNNCDYCYNVIYNAEPLNLLDQKYEIEMLDPYALRLHFTVENEDETKKVLNEFEQVFVQHMEIEKPAGTYTRGHFKRGIK